MEVPRYWRLQKQKYRMVGEECPHCSEKIFPPRDLCPRCGRGTLNNNLNVFIENKVNDNENKSEPENSMKKQRVTLALLN